MKAGEFRQKHFKNGDRFDHHHLGFRYRQLVPALWGNWRLRRLLSQRGGPGFLGGGGDFRSVIDFHYRARSAIWRNTNIMVTFVEPMLVESLVSSAGTPGQADDQINAANIQVSRSADGRLRVYSRARGRER